MDYSHIVNEHRENQCLDKELMQMFSGKQDKTQQTNLSKIPRSGA